MPSEDGHADVDRLFGLEGEGNAILEAHVALVGSATGNAPVIRDVSYA